MMTDFGLSAPLVAARAWRRSMSASVRPPTPRAPTWKKFRRVMPSQGRYAESRKVSMRRSPAGGSLAGVGGGGALGPPFRGIVRDAGSANSEKTRRAEVREHPVETDVRKELSPIATKT